MDHADGLEAEISERDVHGFCNAGLGHQACQPAVCTTTTVTLIELVLRAEVASPTRGAQAVTFGARLRSSDARACARGVTASVPGGLIPIARQYPGARELVESHRREFPGADISYQIAHEMLLFQWQDGKKVIVWPNELAPAVRFGCQVELRCSFSGGSRRPTR